MPDPRLSGPRLYVFAAQWVALLTCLAPVPIEARGAGNRSGVDDPGQRLVSYSPDILGRVVQETKWRYAGARQTTTRLGVDPLVEGGDVGRTVDGRRRPVSTWYLLLGGDGPDGDLTRRERLCALGGEPAGVFEAFVGGGSHAYVSALSIDGANGRSLDYAFEDDLSQTNDGALDWATTPWLTVSRSEGGAMPDVSKFWFDAQWRLDRAEYPAMGVEPAKRVAYTVRLDGVRSAERVHGED